MKILVLSSLAYSLTNFRGDLLQAMLGAGHQVTACAPDRDSVTEQRLKSWGASFAHTPMSRTGTSPFADLKLLADYVRLMRQEKPDIVLAYTQKPIIYGGLAARIAGGRPFYALMSGLGHVFSPQSTFPAPLRRVISVLYREALRRAHATFVFNADDRADMIRFGIVTEKQNVMQVPGSGVSLDRYANTTPPTEKLNFLLIGRLMKNKGIMEFLEASRMVRAQGGDCSFTIVGRCENENPEGLDEASCEKLFGEDDVEFVPGTDDVRPYLRKCSVFVLPSFYREGLPRTILEALSSGRAVITTDLPGCRDPIEEGENGFLVAPMDAADLAGAMMRFVNQPELVISMGNAARAIAETRYDVRLVNRILLTEMGLIDRVQKRSASSIVPDAPPTMSVVGKNKEVGPSL
ncbi:hypothetical protein CP97_06050 [Aurantiacibacter atlanticus]|uniref:Glycosyltransferase subfamily 4-like N-terminal domain-containing protein n=1 Tax=Aurantiacibacter atlanticus TaxID=1648404 RepID=A0A0H4VFV4_9SPHN|nr:glycosyltransferase family 4 protein [Aurantiacibacter atlanticus]AKQ41681.1 hypothetical protein CP97_06050 [Aurantiacibacter atlanticus]MDF1833351.1 glycosyltransferase family 4 protein [Alteraurantiacibacter sp. bin_em_oilr2.035]